MQPFELQQSADKRRPVTKHQPCRRRPLKIAKQKNKHSIRKGIIEGRIDANTNRLNQYTMVYKKLKTTVAEEPMIHIQIYLAPADENSKQKDEWE